MPAAHPHYRASAVGQELEDVLEDFVENDLLTEEQRALILSQFDIAICNELGKLNGKAHIKGPLHHYRNHDDIWSFWLSGMKIKLDNTVTLETKDKTKILSVARK